MNFLAPIPLEEAIAELARKKLVPTWLGSAELAELSAEVRSQALFSARMTQIRPLQALQEGLQLMLEGKANVADVKLMLTEVYRSMGYDSEKGGFPQDRPGTVPPALRGTLRDLASEQRMELIIKTQYAMATSAAFIKRGNEPQRLYQFPALELVRIASRRTPRGFTRRKGALQPVPGEDWSSRFVAAGGELFDKGTRLIALKGSPVWQALGDGQGGYTDTLGNPFSPFAFGSGWGLREVPRAECLLLGVLEPESKAAAMPETLKEGLKAQAKGLDPKLLAAFKKDLVKREDGSVRLKRMLEAETASVAKAYRAAGVPNRAAAFFDLLVLANGGTRAGALLGWITRRLGKGYAGQAYDKVLGIKRPSKARLKAWKYKRVDSAEAARIKAATGLDVSGKYHALDHSSLQHIHGSHGDPVKEAQRGQYAVTRADLVRLHQLHSDPTVKIKLSTPLRDGTQTIQYAWKRHNRTYHLVEEVRAETLVPRTFYITNKQGMRGVAAMDAPPARESPSETPETDCDLLQANTLQNRCKEVLRALQGRAAA